MTETAATVSRGGVDRQGTPQVRSAPATCGVQVASQRSAFVRVQLRGRWLHVRRTFQTNYLHTLHTLHTYLTLLKNELNLSLYYLLLSQKSARSAPVAATA